MYTSLINPFTVVIGFALVILLLDFFKPQAARIVVGIFFLIMAFGVNLTVLLTDPSLIAATGAKALLPVYRWFFTEIIAAHPDLWMIPLILFESTVGCLILSKGKWTRLGLLAGTLWCLWLTPVGIEEVTAPALALAIGLLMRNNFDRSIIEILGGMFQRKAAKAL